MKLSEQPCEACRSDAPALSGEELETLLKELPGWAAINREGVLQLARAYRFPDFAAALAFTNRVGALAEAENHHPSLLTEWGAVTVTWWTHAIGGLHRNDFIMAARTDATYQA